jgi:enoyl-CoA hydratase
MARRLSMTGEVVDADRAERIGLVTEVVPHDHVVERGIELAGQIAEVPGPIMLGLKEIYVRGSATVVDPALAAEDDIAGRQEHDMAGLGDRFGEVARRNRSQLS